MIIHSVRTFRFCIPANELFQNCSIYFGFFINWRFLSTAAR